MARIEWKTPLTCSDKFSFNFTLGHTQSEERRPRDRRESKKVQAAAQKSLSLLLHRLVVDSIKKPPCPLLLAPAKARVPREDWSLDSGKWEQSLGRAM